MSGNHRTCNWVVTFELGTTEKVSFQDFLSFNWWFFLGESEGARRPSRETRWLEVF